MNKEKSAVRPPMNIIFYMIKNKISHQLEDYCCTFVSPDDLWIISKTLNFDNKDTFVARSTFHGPNSNGEVAFDIVSENSTTGWIDGSLYFHYNPIYNIW